MLRAIRKRLFDLNRSELIISTLMSSYFFFVIAVFWILKPIKRGLLIGYYKTHNLSLFGWQLGGAQTEQLAKVANMCVAFVLAVLFVHLARKLSRVKILLLFCAFFGGALLCFAYLINSPQPATIWAFYVFGDIFNTAMVTLFWAIMNDIATPDQAKRSYGIVGLGGVVGGLVGASLVQTMVVKLGRETMLLLAILPIIFTAIVGLVVNRQVKEQQEAASNDPAAPNGGSAVKAFRLILSSKHLLAIAGIVTIYEIASNIVDFQLSASVEQFVRGSLQRDSYFGFVGQLQGLLSILIQLFATSFIMRRFGVGTALMVLPALLLLGSVGFLAMPSLLFATVMSVSDNSLNYSLNQSAKETLYVPTSRVDKYQAKAFIDMFVQRFAKVIAVGINLSMVAYTSLAHLRWLSLITIAVLAIWLLIVSYAGRSFDRMTSRPASPATDHQAPDDYSGQTRAVA